jgi:hypothetical protein
MDRAAYWCAFAPRMMSHPFAAAPTASNWSVIRSGTGWVAAPARGARISMPTAVAANPRPCAHAMKFGGTHSRTSCPSARTSSASAITGCASPRVPTTDSNTRMFPRYRVINRAVHHMNPAGSFTIADR